MSQHNRSLFGNQVESLRRQFAQAPSLPFQDLLTQQQLDQAFASEDLAGYDCVYTPLTTIRLLLSQAIDPDPSLAQAVSRLLAERAAQGRRSISADTGAYSQARQRLPESVLPWLTRHIGQALLERAPSGWLWHRRHVKIVDGTTVSLADTLDNQAAYPQLHHQQPGLGFPIARLVVLFSLAVGTVLDAAIGPGLGKRTGEPALFRTLHNSLNQGDIVLADRYYCSYFEIALLQQRGVDVVMRLHQRRPVDFRKGVRLGKDDHIIVWQKPKRPDWLDEATYAQLPDTLTIREVRLRGTRPGFRTQTIVVATTLLDPREASRNDLTGLYRLRWHAELDLRSLKQTMQMGILRSKTPAMVCKELWAHLLAYNLIRTVIAQAASRHRLKPQHISFKGALQMLVAFASQVLSAPSAELPALAARIQAAIAQNRVGDRPDRYEPRARKRRYDNFQQLRRPRAEAQARSLKGICDDFK